MLNQIKIRMKAIQKHKRKQDSVHSFQQYSLAHELCASGTQPMPKETQEHFFLKVYSALDDFANSNAPDPRSWKLLYDILDLFETMVLDGLCEDQENILNGAEEAIVSSGKLYAFEKQQFSVTEQQLQYLRNMVADFESIVSQIPHRKMIQIHRRTTARLNQATPRKRYA